MTQPANTFEGARLGEAVRDLAVPDQSGEVEAKVQDEAVSDTDLQDQVRRMVDRDMTTLAAHLQAEAVKVLNPVANMHAADGALFKKLMADGSVIQAHVQIAFFKGQARESHRKPRAVQERSHALVTSGDRAVGEQELLEATARRAGGLDKPRPQVVP